MKKWLLVGLIALIVPLAAVACVPGGRQLYPGGMMGNEGTTEYEEMMGSNSMTGYGGMMGSSGMMRHGGMMGPGSMMGGWGGYNPDAEQITIDQAAESVERYLNAYWQDLAAVEVMEFTWNFYAEVEDETTGIHAMELLIDKYTGQVYPEMGPNMMWNTKYGMMGSYNKDASPAADMTVTEEQAEELAQQFLDTNLPGVTTGEAEVFYGYYTMHTLENGRIEGMLSVNGYDGAVWYHNWHGPFIQMEDFEH
ncbi:MAG: hypothetical protein ISS51_00070 [Dehalococcoidales bacterium]|nr:hypothetical protein [Dehalococcoidales bacterium]